MSRFALLAPIAALSLATGCANDDLVRHEGARMHLIGAAVTTAADAETEPAAEPVRPAPPMPRRAMPASKVLSAIALERVTGRKPDPGRLLQVD